MNDLLQKSQRDATPEAFRADRFQNDLADGRISGERESYQFEAGRQFMEDTRLPDGSPGYNNPFGKDIPAVGGFLETSRAIHESVYGSPPDKRSDQPKPESQQKSQEGEAEQNQDPVPAVAAPGFVERNAATLAIGTAQAIHALRNASGRDFIEALRRSPSTPMALRMSLNGLDSLERAAPAVAIGAINAINRIRNTSLSDVAEVIKRNPALPQPLRMSVHGIEQASGLVQEGLVNGAIWAARHDVPGVVKRAIVPHWASAGLEHGGDIWNRAAPTLIFNAAMTANNLKNNARDAVPVILEGATIASNPVRMAGEVRRVAPGVIAGSVIAADRAVRTTSNIASSAAVNIADRVVRGPALWLQNRIMPQRSVASGTSESGQVTDESVFVSPVDANPAAIRETAISTNPRARDAHSWNIRSQVEQPAAAESSILSALDTEGNQRNHQMSQAELDAIRRYVQSNQRQQNPDDSPALAAIKQHLNSDEEQQNGDASSAAVQQKEAEGPSPIRL